jgi:BCD family chlorophyll transporter-like MFS transporter
VVVLTTSTLNRVMVVELALPALVPGLLVALHYAGAADAAAHGPRRRPGRAPHAVDPRRHGVLALGGALARGGHGLDGPPDRGAGMALAVLAFLLIGLGVSAAAPRCWCCWPSAWRPSAAPAPPRWCG